MKKLLLLGVASLSMVACGNSNPTPAPVYPYNPNANGVQQTDARVPYRGDWVFVAQLPNNQMRYGVASMSVKYSDANIVNASGGAFAWCVSTDCKTNDEQGAGIVGTTKTTSGNYLTAGMVPTGKTAPRFVMADNNGLVEVVDGKPSIAGAGIWTDDAGVDQQAVFAFVQVKTDPSVKAQAASSGEVLAAQNTATALLRTSGLTAQSGVLPVGLREAFANALRRQ